MAITTHLLEAALGYGKRGWKVFPVEELGKVPRISVKEGGKGVHDATTKASQIETWWSRWPNANIGLHCETFWVLDVDPKNGGPDALAALLREYGPLPNTLTQTSGSGGKHYLFNSPKGIFIQNRAGFYPGLDTRAYGGYIVATPSETEKGAYSWDNEGTPIADAPEWLLSMVKKTKEQFKMKMRSDTGSRDMDDASLAGALHNMGFGEDEMFQILMMRNNDDNRRDVPLPSNEIWKTVRSISKRDIHTPSGLMQAIHERSKEVKLEKPDHEPDVLWIERSIKSTSGAPKNCIANAEAALVNSPVFCNSLCFDELRQEAMLKRSIVDPMNSKVIGNLKAGAPITDNVTREMLIVAQRLISEVTFTEEIFGAAIQVVARQNSFNPVQDYLNGIVWDGVKRIDSWLIDYFGCADNIYVRGVGRRWLISAVNRALVPGSIANSMLIIEGPQDIAKSKALRALTGSQFFKDTRIDLNSKDKFTALRGVWIYELAEFDQYKGHDAAAMKSFISSQEDSYRPPYGRCDVRVPRSSVFVGSVNPDKYLIDVTGNKRYWPVKNVKNTKYNPISTDKIEQDRDQLWAEAVRAYYNGEAGFLDKAELIEAHENETNLRMDLEDTWEPYVLAYMRINSKRKDLTTADIIVNSLNMPINRAGNKEKDRVKRVLELNGWVYRSVRINGRSTKAWRRSEQDELSLEGTSDAN